MGRVVASASMSLDGFVAAPDDSVGALFDWYGNGDVEVPNAGDLPPMRMTEASARYWQDWTSQVGALVVGRHLFDITDGWHGTHPLGVPVVVLTRTPPIGWSYPGSERFTFVSGGIEQAVVAAQRIAGDLTVGVAAGRTAGQAAAAGLLDAAAIDLVPITLGAGVRYFEGASPVVLGDPEVVVQGRRVLHLVHAIERGTLTANR